MLRNWLWLLLTACLGGLLGAHLAGSASDPAGVRAAPELAAVRHVAAQTAARSHTAVAGPGLEPLRAGLHTIRDGVAAARAVSVAPAGEHVIAFSAAARTLSANAEGLPADQAPVGAAPPAVTFATQAPAAPIGPPLVLSDVRTLSLTPFAATIAWRTNDDSTDRIAYGLDSLSLWTGTSGPGREHQAVVTGLAFATSYRLEVEASTADGRAAVAAYTLTTPALSGATSASTQAGALELDGQPFFPTMVWAQCADGYAGNLAVGIDLFMGNDCENGRQQLDRLGGRALSVADMHETSLAGTGLLGWYLPDEWDTHLPSNLTAADVARSVPTGQGGVRFLTLTNHFYSRAPRPFRKAAGCTRPWSRTPT